MTNGFLEQKSRGGYFWETRKVCAAGCSPVTLRVMSEQLTPETLLPGLEAEWERQGDIFDVTVNDQERIVLANPADIHSILTDGNYAEKGHFFGGIQLFGDEITSVSGAEWRKSRDITGPAFHRQAVKDMTSRVAAVGAKFADDLRARDGEVINVQKEMTHLSLQTILGVLFGKHVETADRLAYQTLNETLEFATLPQNEINNGDTQRKFMDHIVKLNDIAQGIIDRTRAAGHDQDSLDLPNLLVHSRDKQTGEPLDDERIRNELLAFLFAGHETTSLTMTWFHKLLEDRSDITEKIQAEVDAVLGERTPQLEDLSKLTYTRQVIDEVLRFRATVPLVSRTARDDTKLGDRQIKSGDVVVPFIWGAHKHPDFWRNPEMFDPDRFSAEHSAGRDRRAYLPFGLGNRLCIGKALALTELTVFAAALAQRTTFEMEPNDAQPAVYVTVRPDSPIHATVRSRP